MPFQLRFAEHYGWVVWCSPFSTMDPPIPAHGWTRDVFIWTVTLCAGTHKCHVLDGIQFILDLGTEECGCREHLEFVIFLRQQLGPRHMDP